MIGYTPESPAWWIVSGAASFRVGDQPGIVVPPPYDQMLRGYLKFSLTGLSGKTLTSATLYIYVDFSYLNGIADYTSPLDNPGLGDYWVIHIGDYGTLDASDWNPTLLGNDPGVFIPGIGPSSTPNIGYISIDITVAMQDDLDNGRAFSAFMIKPITDRDNDSSRDNFWFFASESSGTSQDPYIEYELEEEPPVGGVIISVNKLVFLAPYIVIAGLVAVVIIRRRKA